MLYFVPTPIGNLKDITYRSVEILKEVDVILAEDTRVSGKLLKYYNIETPMLSYHQHNEHKLTDDIIKRLQQGENIALITDAGTPGISDPGFLLSRACMEHNVPQTCLPGATAFVPALVMSGLPNDRFVFEGFLPPKKHRKKRLELLKEEERSIILYESPYKLLKTLKDLKEYLGEDRLISISRELSKIYEEVTYGSIDFHLKMYESKKPKGEFVIIIKGKD
jgi:16S rRNA (cytidine1402-2'-O)-methyltransferase